MKTNIQPQAVCRKSSVLAFAIISMALFVAVFSSCKDDDDDAMPDRVTAATGVRLVHSSFKNSTTPVDLFIDDAKATNANIAYLGASSVYPLSAGQHKITAKTNTGTIIADTTLTIADATQYSFFIKDRAWTTGTVTASIKTGFVAVPDNNTTPPDAGMAKIRFVNASSGPLNGPTGSLSFSRVIVTGNLTSTSMITQSLGLSNSKMYSEYLSLAPGEYTFRVNASTATLLDATYQYDMTVTLEAGKLYTGFGTSTQHTVKTPSKSPVSLTVIAN